MSTRPSAASNTTASRSAVEQKDEESAPSHHTSSSPPSSSPIAVPRPRHPYNRDEVKAPVLSYRRAAQFGEFSPLLSERDSIFAEHYLPSHNDTPTSPPYAEQAGPSRLPQENRWSKSSLDFSASLSPPRTQRSSHQNRLSFDKNISAQHIPTATAASLTTAAGSSQGLFRGIRRVASENQHLDSLGYPLPRRLGTMAASSLMDEDEHADDLTAEALQDVVESTVDQRQSRGMSMKQAIQTNRPDRSSSRGRSHVEKSIEVTLPKTEQITNARSRKSSHYMGLFRENTALPDSDVGLSRNLKIHESLAQIYAPSTRPQSSDRQDSPVEEAHDEDPTLPKPTFDRPTQRSWSGMKSTSDHGPSSLSSNTALDPSISHDPSVPSPTKAVGQHDPYFRAHDEVKQQLLQQIRQLHQDKARLSVAQGAPTIQEAQRDKISVEVNQHVPSRSEGEAEEHMSKVEYKPHAGRTPEDIERLTGVDISPDDTDHHMRELTDVEHFDSRRLATRTPPPEHIDIFIESKHEKKAFHGSYQPPEDVDEDFEVHADKLPAISEYPDPKISSTSETELESGEEEALESHAEDGEITPTGLVDHQNLFRPRRKSKPAQPKAVVLDPYSHQVGGHSTMFHFSRQAVCKQLNNRENEFYERIEVRHPDLRRFLPR